LEHLYSGPELKLSYAQATLENLYQLWRRPVNIETVLENRVTILSYDGSHHEKTKTKQFAEGIEVP
jgi:stage V sporulation protein R